MRISEIEEGTLVIHENWDLHTSEPMEIVKEKEEIMLRDLETGEITEFDAGGENFDGWIIIS